MINCKIFAIKSNSFQRTYNYPFPFTLVFVTEAIFISEQITECRFGALLEIADTFSCKLNGFAGLA